MKLLWGISAHTDYTSASDASAGLISGEFGEVGSRRMRSILADFVEEKM